MKETKNYKLQLPEQTDNIDIDVLDANFTELDTELAKTDKNASDHAADKNNPHEVNKGQLGLERVENKSSADIRAEMTKKNVTDALGYTPAGSSHSHNISDISNLSTRLSQIESRLTLLEGKALTVESWADIASVSVTTSNTGDIDECYNFISGSMTTTWGQTISIRCASTGNPMRDGVWGHEEQSTRSAYLDYNGNLYLLYYDTDEHNNDISHPSGTIYVGLAGMGQTYTYTRTAPITSDFDD